MRFLDLLTMSVGNLRRRKLRTFLTVLGVVIGTAAIVVMVSLGIGLQELNMELISSYGSMTAIEVYSDAQYNNDGKSEPNFMTDETMELFGSMEHVRAVSPLLTTNVIIRQGIYQANYVSLIGVSQDYMKEIPVGKGVLPSPADKELKLVVGNMVAQQFSNSKTGRGYWDGEMIDENYTDKPLFVIFDVDAYHSSQGGGENQPKPPKKYMLEASGVVEGGPEDWNSYCYNLYADIDLLKAQLSRVFKKKTIPGQPTNRKGKPYPYYIYDQAVVFVDDMKNVTQVQKKISDLGFQASSNMDWLEQSKQQSNMIQAVLGGIGGVSLLVAAIGIANTMMMSIYERTREIGVIKVLGCDMRNIQGMFLLESGFIGFIGGVTGLGLSYGISMLMNKFLVGRMLQGMDGDISRIPTWLAGAAVLFAVFVGMAAGFFPSLRAMRLSPLAAIRNE